MNNVGTILQKQWKDTWKNKVVLIQFLMFPVLGVVMTNMVKIDGMPEHFFANLFSTMYVGMAPLTSMSAILSEEKEKNTLRVLMMAGVKPGQYLAGIGCYVYFACLLGAGVFCALLGRMGVWQVLLFFAIMSAGILASMMLGAAIGVGSRNQMAATSVTVPVMMVFSFLPMIAMFHDGVARAAKLTYSEQVRILVSGLLEKGGDGSGMAWVVIGGNILVFGGVFAALYQRRGLA